MKSLAFCLFMLCLSLPFAAAAGFIPDELCGDGIDNKQQFLGQEGSCPAGWVKAKALGGCDMLCPQPDADWDGYKDKAACNMSSEKCDCAPEDKFVYPGSGLTTVGCSGGLVHECRDDGNFTACSQFTCPTGRHCYFFDAATGNNSTGDGTITKPWRDLSKVSYWYYTKTPPFQVHQQVAGDMYILRGGTYAFDADLGYRSRTFQCREVRSTSPSLPITITSYPGESVVIAPTAPFTANAYAFYFEGCSNWVLQNITIRGGNGSAVSVASGSADTEGIVMRNLVVTSPNANGDNFSCITFHSTVDSKLENNILYDCYKAANAESPNPRNNSLLLSFRDRNLQILYNTAFYTSYDDDTVNGDVTGQGIKQKHAVYESSLRIVGNTVFNAGVGGVDLAGGNWLVKKHLSYNNKTHLFHGDLGGGSFASGIYTGGKLIVEDSTFINAGQFVFSPTKRYSHVSGATLSDNCQDDYPIATLVLRNNVIVSDRQSYNQENREFVSHVYGPDFFYDLSRFSFYNNTWYNGNVSPTFGFHESNNGNTTCEGRGVKGGSYSWGAWQDQGFDTDESGSSNEDPELDEYLRATATGHNNKGRIKLSDEASEPVDSPGNLRGVLRNP